MDYGTERGICIKSYEISGLVDDIVGDIAKYSQQTGVKYIQQSRLQINECNISVRGKTVGFMFKPLTVVYVSLMFTYIFYKFSNWKSRIEIPLTQ